MGMVFKSRRAQSIAVRLAISLLALVLVACGGDDANSTDGGDDRAANGSGGTAVVGGDDGADAGETSGGGAMATLTVAGDIYTWTAEQMTVCEIDGIFGPANADFGIPPSQGGEGPWVQFIDRGDGGINFSAVIDGEEYSGTGSGEADEVRSDGFTYTGNMTRSGERLDVELEVSC